MLALSYCCHTHQDKDAGWTGADVQWVVTEFGTVNLYGKSLQERAKLLISISHPDDRELLDRVAFERFGSHWRYGS